MTTLRFVRRFALDEMPYLRGIPGSARFLPGVTVSNVFRSVVTGHDTSVLTAQRTEWIVAEISNDEFHASVKPD